MWVRNVGHLMTNPAILLPDGSEVPEGLMDAMVTVTIALHDLKKTEGLRNSVTGFGLCGEAQDARARGSRPSPTR